MTVTLEWELLHNIKQTIRCRRGLWIGPVPSIQFDVSRTASTQSGSPKAQDLMRLVCDFEQVEH